MDARGWYTILGVTEKKIAEPKTGKRKKTLFKSSGTTHTFFLSIIHVGTKNATNIKATVTSSERSCFINKVPEEHQHAPCIRGVEMQYCRPLGTNVQKLTHVHVPT